MAKGKLTRIGQVWQSKDSTEENPKYFLKLGSKNPKKPQYDISVELVVKDSEGNVVTQATDTFLTIADPRKSQFSNGKEPQNLMFDVLVGKEEN